MMGDTMMEEDNIGDTVKSNDTQGENSTGYKVNPRVIMEKRIRAKYPDGDEYTQECLKYAEMVASEEKGYPVKLTVEDLLRMKEKAVKIPDPHYYFHSSRYTRDGRKMIVDEIDFERQEELEKELLLGFADALLPEEVKEDARVMAEMSETEKEALRSGEPFDPSRSYTSMLHLAASDLAYFQQPYWTPHEIPRDDWDILPPGVDDLEADLAAVREEIDKNAQSEQGESGLEQHTVSAMDGKAVDRLNFEGGKDKTPFFQLCFLRVGVAFATGFGIGGLMGATSTWQANSHLPPALLRNTMINSIFKYGTNWGNRLGVLAFLYTGSYVAIRDHVREAKYFKEDKIYEENFAVCTSAGTLTGLLYSISVRQRRSMLLSAAVGGISCALATSPYSLADCFPRYRSVQKFIRRVSGRQEEGAMFKPMGIEKDELDEEEF